MLNPDARLRWPLPLRSEGYELLDLARLRLAVERLRPDVVRFADEDRLADDRFDAFELDVRLDVEGDFLAVDLPPVFFAVVFLLGERLLDDFFAGDRLEAADRFAALDRFFFCLDFCMRSRTRAVVPMAAPSAAAPVAASTGFSATALATFFAPPATFFAPVVPTFFAPPATVFAPVVPALFAPLPTADAASPAFPAAFDAIERPFSAMSSIGSRRRAIRCVRWVWVIAPPLGLGLRPSRRSRAR